MKRLPDGTYAIGGDISIPGEGTSPFVVGVGWLLEIIELGSGKYFFFCDGKEVPLTLNRFGIFYPPFSIVKFHVYDMKGKYAGIGGFNGLPSGLPAAPLIFETDWKKPFTAAADAAEVLAAARNILSIEINTRPSLLSLRAKRLIDENYQVYPSIARIAARLKVSPEHLSRQFKRDYEMNPSSYLHQVRLAEATFKLSIGEEIAAISHDVGYNDLSRFYKQFRKATKTSPGDCRTTLRSERF
jgi:AraC-like DNA-binding protein